MAATVTELKVTDKDLPKRALVTGGLSVDDLQGRHRAVVDVYKYVERPGFVAGVLNVDILPLVASVRPILKRFETMTNSEDWEERLEGLEEYITKVGCGWDMVYPKGSVDEEGNDLSGTQWPFTQENVDKLPSAVQGDILRAMYAYMQEGEETASTSTTASSEQQTQPA